MAFPAEFWRHLSPPGSDPCPPLAALSVHKAPFAHYSPLWLYYASTRSCENQIGCLVYISFARQDFRQQLVDAGKATLVKLSPPPRNPVERRLVRSIKAVQLNVASFKHGVVPHTPSLVFQ